MNLNKIQLIGRITKKPELRSLPSGTQVCSFSIATNQSFKKEDKWEEKVTFHNVVSFGKTAENVAQYVVKGQEVYVEGRQENDTYEKKDGTTGYRSQVIAQIVQFGQKPKDAPQDAGDKELDELAGKPEEEEINADDIPF